MAKAKAVSLTADLLSPLAQKLRDAANAWNTPGKTPPEPCQIEGWLNDAKLPSIVTWLKVNHSVELANDFERTLSEPVRAYHRLTFRACQVLVEDYHGWKTDVSHVQQAVPKAIRRLTYLKGLEEAYDAHDEAARWQRYIDELEEPYYAIPHQLRVVSRYIMDMVALLKSKFGAKPLTITDNELAEMLFPVVTKKTIQTAHSKDKRANLPDVPDKNRGEMPREPGLQWARRKWPHMIDKLR